jgi:hypothetical protein
MTARQTPARRRECLPYLHQHHTTLALIAVMILALVLLGADPTLALGSFAGIAAAAARLARA